MSKEPSRKPKEWTPWHEAQGSYIPQSVCDKHNAALAAERDKHTKAYLSFRQRLNAFEQQLAAEREKSRILGNMTDGFRNQIKEHQAEYDRLSKIMEKDSFTIVELNAALADLQTDLALATQMCGIEGKRANEAQAALAAEQERHKPLVEALERLIKVWNASDCNDDPKVIQKAIDNGNAGLASAKDQP